MKTVFLLLASAILVSAVPLNDRENISDLIIGGNSAPLTGVSYQVTFRTILALHWCGGSIINSRWVLTAAQCLDKRAPSSITVIVGSNSLDAGGSFYPAQSIEIHPSYDRKTFVNDVGLLQVSTPFLFTSRVQPVTLGSSYVGGGVSATLSGWGHTNQQKTRPNLLQIMATNTITNADCTTRLAVRDEESLVVDSKMCTFTRAGQGTCSGDIGGPLVAVDNTQIGILSWNIQPCASGYPDGYERVQQSRAWIMSVAVV